MYIMYMRYICIVHNNHEKIQKEEERKRKQSWKGKKESKKKKIITDNLHFLKRQNPFVIKRLFKTHNIVKMVKKNIDIKLIYIVFGAIPESANKKFIE